MGVGRFCPGGNSIDISLSPPGRASVARSPGNAGSVCQGVRQTEDRLGGTNEKVMAGKSRDVEHLLKPKKEEPHVSKAAGTKAQRLMPKSKRKNSRSKRPSAWGLWKRGERAGKPRSRRPVRARWRRTDHVVIQGGGRQVEPDDPQYVVQNAA